VSSLAFSSLAFSSLAFSSLSFIDGCRDHFCFVQPLKMKRRPGESFFSALLESKINIQSFVNGASWDFSDS
jgi:hypothetical protein